MQQQLQHNLKPLGYQYARTLESSELEQEVGFQPWQMCHSVQDIFLDSVFGHFPKALESLTLRWGSSQVADLDSVIHCDKNAYQ